MPRIRIGHSPDPDDAFMFYALTTGKVKAGDIEVEHVLEDIESLNRRSRTAELEVTAVSAATYTMIHDRYRMMDPGASMAKACPSGWAAGERWTEGHRRQVIASRQPTTAARILRMYATAIRPNRGRLRQIAKPARGQADLGL